MPPLKGIFFCGALKTGLGFTPLLPNCTIKVDFELADNKFFFLSPTFTDLKISFENWSKTLPLVKNVTKIEATCDKNVVLKKRLNFR